MKHLQEITESGQEITADEPVTRMDYSAEKTPIEWISEGALNEKYSFVSELSRYVVTLYKYYIGYYLLLGVHFIYKVLQKLDILPSSDVGVVAGDSLKLCPLA